MKTKIVLALSLLLTSYSAFAGTLGLMGVVVAKPFAISTEHGKKYRLVPNHESDCKVFVSADPKKQNWTHLKKPHLLSSIASVRVEAP